MAGAIGAAARRAGAELRHGRLRAAAGAAGAEGLRRPHRPRVVVLAFFAGNDIFDAEAFDAFQRSGGTQQRAAQGWRIKDVISRADTWFVVSALRAGAAMDAAATGGRRGRDEAAPNNRWARGGLPGDGPRSIAGCSTVPVAGRRLPFALHAAVPQHLEFLRDRAAKRARDGGSRATPSPRCRRCRSPSAATFVVMFVPFKSQVYLPLLERAFPKDVLRVRIPLLPGRHTAARWMSIALHANRLAQNASDAAVLRRGRHRVRRHDRRAHGARVGQARTSTSRTNLT